MAIPFLLAGAFTGTAGAAEAEAARASQTVERRVSVEEQQKAAEYWTPERMARATNADRLVTGDAGSMRRPAQVQRQEEVLAEPVVPGDVNASIYKARQAGKVFSVDSKGKEWECSASIVNSPSRNMVFTAGHCVHEGGGGNWHRDWTFVPDYDRGRRPFGNFIAYTLVTLRGWAEQGTYAYDSALALVNPGHTGQRLVDLVGVANGLRVGGPFNRHHVVFGYPQNYENAQVQIVCTGPSEQATSFFPRQITMRCGMGEGASGGPWLTDYQDRSDGYGIGFVHGVTSNYDPFGNLRSPYFQNEAEGNMYREYMNR